MQASSLAIDDYALIGDCTTAALVGSNGAIDWLCWPRFDSAACFARLLGNPNNGQWQIAPKEGAVQARRAYQGASMILETEFENAAGQITVTDFMPIGESSSSIVRIVEGRRGSVAVRMAMTLRFDYGSTVPWVYRDDAKSGIIAIAGPNLAILRASVAMHSEALATVSDFTVAEGQKVTFTLSYGQSHLAPPPAMDAFAALRRTTEFWHSWSSRCTYHGPRHDAVIRSLLTLKALTFIETGGIVAAPTTSLPEQLGGSRNWDYRYCWIRDATLTLTALMGAGYYDEAKAWRNWLHRSLAGTPEDLQIMYGICGERRLAEREVPWLSGYQGASPVRVGNAASGQLQLDVWGEMMDALHLAREGDLVPSASGWDLQCQALKHLESHWKEPDDGLWEVRGGRRQFTHSKVMAWVAFDRSIRDALKFNLDAPLARWRAVRDEIHRTVCEQGFDARRKTFTQCFGSPELDASLLLIAQVDFLPITDPRVTGTIDAVERELLVDGFVLRYRSESGADGLPAGEGVFLACSFWLADVYQRQGRHAEAHALVDRLLALRNDVGLLSEEYDTKARRQVGNFPQAFSHLSLVQTVMSLHHGEPLRDRITASKPGLAPTS